MHSLPWLYHGHGVVKLINFAHGDIMMVSAYFLLIGMVHLDFPYGYHSSLLLSLPRF